MKWNEKVRGRRSVKKYPLGERLLTKISAVENAVLKVKGAMSRIQYDYIARLQKADLECARADEEERDVDPSLITFVQEAEGWTKSSRAGMKKSVIKKIVDDAVRDFPIADLHYYLKQKPEWRANP